MSGVYTEKCCLFKELTLEELYNILKLREQVFIQEQKADDAEIDGLDPLALHLFLKDEGEIIAYLRIFPKGVKGDEVTFGRVVVAPFARGKKLSHFLIMRALSEIEKRYGASTILISAQAHLKELYKKHGFEPVGTPYIEAGILHIAMMRPLNA